MTIRKMLWCLLFSVLLLAAALAYVYAQFVVDDKKILAGLDGVRVVVERTNPDVEKLGLTEASLRTAAELRLRQLGIKILTMDEWLDTPGAQVLYVNVNTIVESSGQIFYSISVEHREMMIFVRPPRNTTLAATWNKGCVGTTANTSKIKENVLDLVDRYANDYLAANPKKK